MGGVVWISNKISKIESLKLDNKSSVLYNFCGAKADFIAVD
jgi:hypothetical protein